MIKIPIGTISENNENELARVWNDQLPKPIKKIKIIKTQFTKSLFIDLFLIKYTDKKNDDRIKAIFVNALTGSDQNSGPVLSQ